MCLLHVSNQFAMRAVVQDKQSSALDLVLSAARKNVARKVKIKASGREFIPSPRRQIYVGNIAFNTTEDDVMEAIFDLTNTTVDTCTMPRSGGRNRGYAFVTIAWPSEFKHNGADGYLLRPYSPIGNQGRPIPRTLGFLVVNPGLR